MGDGAPKRPCPHRGGEGPSTFHRTRCLDEAGNPCCEAHGGQPAAGFMDLRRGGKNSADHRRELVGFGNAAVLSTIEKLHCVEAALELWEDLKSDQDALCFLQDPNWCDHARGESNFQLNNTDLFLRSEYSAVDLPSMLLALWLARVWFNADGAVEDPGPHPTHGVLYCCCCC